MGKIGIILLNYCNYDLTIDCIESIKKSSYQNYEIIVIDNNSPDNSGKQLSKLDNIRFLQMNENLGFAAGNNRGIEVAISDGGEYVR